MLHDSPEGPILQCLFCILRSYHAPPISDPPQPPTPTIFGNLRGSEVDMLGHADARVSLWGSCDFAIHTWCVIPCHTCCLGSCHKSKFCQLWPRIKFMLLGQSAAPKSSMLGRLAVTKTLEILGKSHARETPHIK